MLNHGFAAILPEKPFSDVLAAHLTATLGPEPETLACALVLLPSRRACAALKEAFLRINEGRGMLLPRIQPIGEVEDEAPPGWADAGTEPPSPVIAPLHRTLLLARLVAGLGAAAASRHLDNPVHSILLGGELARFLDEVQRENLSLAELSGLVPQDYQEHWQIALKFLQLLEHEWPKILTTLGSEEPVAQRNRMLLATAEAWLRRPPVTPVIAAGSTGSTPATARLLRVIAGLPQGLVVLPGLDWALTEEAWESLTESHPQFGLKQLLKSAGIGRELVRPLDAEAIPASCGNARVAFLRAGLAPASAWLRAPLKAEADMLSRFHLLPCATQAEEAKTIALILRHALETPGKTAALITRDRALARMVAASLEPHGIRIDDSAGQGLGDTPPGVFLRLLAELLAAPDSPVVLLNLLKHPLAAGGIPSPALRAAVREAEKTLLRGVRIAPKGKTLLEAVACMEHKKLSNASREALCAAGNSVTRFLALAGQRRVPLDTLARAHIDAAEALATTDEEPGAGRLWKAQAGEELAAFVAELIDAAQTMKSVEPGAYAGVFGTLLAARRFRPRYGMHPRLHILSPMEARLQHFGTVVLGGLNEGSWPGKTEEDPWMSRPMRARFGLPMPERQVGQSAHDFAMLCCAPEVILTRAEKAEGKPTVPSRWLLRLDALCRAAFGHPLSEHGEELPYRRWLALLERPVPANPLPPPRPAPPLAARPRKLPVTQIERLMRDPYGVYARYVLGLRKLDPLDQEPGAADFGTIVHDALARFTKRCPAALPEDALSILLVCGREAFARHADKPAIAGVWWPRFEAMAGWLVEVERERRKECREVLGEVDTAMHLPAAGGEFTVTARIDRVERRRDGSLCLVDYKTGSPPAKKEIESGVACQLPLAAVIAEQGGVAPLGNAPVTALEYWKLSGEGSANEISPLGEGNQKTVPLRELIENAEAMLGRLISAYDDPARPYLVCPDAARAPKPGQNDYTHLERMDEWTNG